jgi:hypothetical protein
MNFGGIIALGSAWLLGVFAVTAFWPGTRSWRSDALLILSLGIAVGLGVTSILFFAASLLSAHPARISAIVEWLLLLGLMAWLWKRARENPVAVSSVNPVRVTWLGIFTASLLAQAVVVAVVTSSRAAGAEPLGGWDGWAIWNMHARFIVRGGETWPELLRHAELGWTHPDYPLLVSASVARAWAFAGAEAPAISATVSALFGFATVGTLLGATLRLREPTTAFVGGLVLLGTPFFVTFASNQHADIPLGCFMLATLSLFVLRDSTANATSLAALAGITAGLAAWTKNEGMLFALIAALGWGIDEIRRGSRRSAAAFYAGLIAALLPVIYFKVALAPPTDLWSAKPGGQLAQLFEGARHRVILGAFWREATRFGEWHVLPFLVMALPLIGDGWRRLNAREWCVGAAIATMLAGYYVIYLLTPMNLAWHLDFSLVRLLLQLWPAALFFWCLAVTVPRTSAVDSIDVRKTLPRRGVVLRVGLANVAIATGVCFAFGSQRAVNELASTRLSGTRVTVITGEGWFGQERDTRHRWVWSRGESILWLNLADANAATPVALTFALRSLGARTVTAKVGDQILWQGRIGEQLTPIETAPFKFQPGLTPIVFTTDTAGVRESPNADSRMLTFALYDLRL